VFEEIARINQYDLIQDSFGSNQLTLIISSQLEPQNRNWAIALALSEVPTQNGAIAALVRVIYTKTLLTPISLIHSYDWQASAAGVRLKSAVALNPQLTA